MVGRSVSRNMDLRDASASKNDVSDDDDKDETWDGKAEREALIEYWNFRLVPSFVNVNILLWLQVGM